MLDWLKAIVAPAVNFVSGLFTNSSNKKQTEATNATNLQIAQDTNAANMTMNRENIAFQQAENDIARQREDNAVQRRVSDLTAAGLSKTLAAGSPASANAMNAPNNQFPMQTGNRMESFHADAPKFDFDYAAVKNNLANADAVRQNADTAAKNAQTEADRLQFEKDKWEQEHTYEVGKTEWEHEFEERKQSFDENIRKAVFKWQKIVDFANISLKEKSYLLDKKELGLKADELENKIKDSMSQRSYTEFKKRYESAMLEISEHADIRAQMLIGYNILQAKAEVMETMSKVNVNNFTAKLIREQVINTATDTVKKFCDIYNLPESVRYSLEKYLIGMYNDSIVANDGSSSGPIPVGSPAATENQSKRHSELVKTVLTTAGHIGVGLGVAFIGIGGRAHSVKEFDNYQKWLDTL